MSVEASVELDSVYNDIRSIIENGRNKIAVSINSEITMLYWEVGRIINLHILENRRADYGKQVVASLSFRLRNEFGGKSWTEKHLRQMMQFAAVFPDKEIVYTLCIQFTWSHLRSVFYIEDPLKRKFYLELCRVEHWSVRTLRDKINSMLYERTAISKKPEDTIAMDLSLISDQDKMSADMVFHDPVFLDFLGLKDDFAEKDLEDAIIAELQGFITELGSDFAFMARQKRITIDNEDYYIDLLFYHRRLRCLVAIDLKIGRFKAAHKGQMELYLRWLEKYEMVEGEGKPIGLVLCAGKNEEHIELLHLEESNIRVAEYMTKLPERKLLEKKLQLAIQRAKSKLSNSSSE